MGIQLVSTDWVFLIAEIENVNIEAVIIITIISLSPGNWLLLKTARWSLDGAWRQLDSKMPTTHNLKIWMFSNLLVHYYYRYSVILRVVDWVVAFKIITGIVLKLKLRPNYYINILVLANMNVFFLFVNKHIHLFMEKPWRPQETWVQQTYIMNRFRKSKKSCRQQKELVRLHR